MLKKKAQALEAQMAGEKEYTAYCLKESGHKGDLLDEDALVPVVVKTESDFFVPDKSDLLGKHLSAGNKSWHNDNRFDGLRGRCSDGQHPHLSV